MRKDRLNIIYEDKYLLVVDKPAGLLTIATIKEKEKTLFHQAFIYEKKKNKNNKIFIVHRLDRETSGIVVFAKSEMIKDKMQKDWENTAIAREYTGVVEGKVLKDNDIITSYIKENIFLKSYSSDDETGKLATTEYKVLKRSKGYSLLQIQIRSGRKNQIRVHMSDIGNPIVGDKKYGAKTSPLRRIGLHANKMILIHPITKEKVVFTSDIPDLFLGMFKGGNNEIKERKTEK